jgi:two-component system response regulator HydG
MEMVHFIPPTQRRLVILAAQADTAPVLICGASGTGKGAIAKWIHENGPRAGFPYVEGNHDAPLAAQIPQAQGGTLLIPELAEWPMAEQMALLKFLKSKTLRQNGLSLLTNIRVIATSGTNIDSRAAGGLFNSDLLEALNVFRIEMPSLSDRVEEFEDIVLSILNETTSDVHKEHLRSFSREAFSVLRSYDWPGNIRELRNVLKIAVLAAKGDEIEVTDLPDFGHDRIDFRATREQFEKIYLMELLKTFDWQIDRTCRMARMDKDTLLAKINHYGIRVEATGSV